jgi:hypothetical protein
MHRNFFFGQPEKKIPLGRYKRRSEGKTEMGLLKIGCDNVDWIQPALI